MDGTTLTLSDVIGRLEQDTRLSPPRRRDLISAVRRISKVSGVDPRFAPACLKAMRPHIRAVRPARHDLAPKTWSNLRSDFRAAITGATPQADRKRDPSWDRLRPALPNERMKKGLSRFIRFCERSGIAPTVVSDAVSARFLAYLETSTMLAVPQDCHRRTCRLWNEAARTIDGWPRVDLSVPGYRKPRQTLRISSFPESLQREVENYLQSLRAGDIFAKDGPRRPFSPGTIRKLTTQIGLALSALVASGREATSITSLNDLVEPSAFTAVLRRYLNVDGKPRPTAHHLAHTLVKLATYVLIEDDPASLDQIKELKRLQKCLGPIPAGLTDKNRSLLRTLDDPGTRAKLLLLPERSAAFARRAFSARAAISFEIATAIAILECAPLRISNLAHLRLDQHLVRPGGPRSLWQIHIPADEVKNNQALVYELPFRVTAMLDRFIRHFRPLLIQTDNPYLFPVGSRYKHERVLSKQIRRMIENRVGVHMTPHQFRHWAARLMQEHSPGAYAAIAQLLGHKNLHTVIAYYAELDTLSAGRHFDTLLDAALAKARLPRGRRP